MVKITAMKMFFIPICLFIVTTINAQVKEGKVIYERTMQMRRPQGMTNEIQLPPTRTDNFELLFGNNQSLWQAIPNPEGDNNTITAPGMVLRMAGNNDVTYFNFAAGKRLDQREMLEREFLVEDSIAKLSWKLSEESKVIVGHTARKASAQRFTTRMQMTMENGNMKREEVADTSTLVAWFTTDVIVPAGPQEFQGQLPGLILELSINNGRTEYHAVEMSPKVNLSHIKPPKGGKKLTAAEFVLEREKLMEEMRKNNPGGNRVIRN